MKKSPFKFSLIIFLLLTLVLSVTYFGVGYYIYSTLARAEPGCSNDCVNNPSSFRDNSEVSNFPFDEYQVDYWESHQYDGGDEGIIIDAWWLPINQEKYSNAPVVILVHGLRVSKYDPDMLTVAGMLHKEGFSVLLFDLRDHGKSTIEDSKISIGTKEYRDVIASVDWLIDIKGIDAKRIGIYGDSMGAATAAIAFGKDDRIQSLVLDNGYLDLNIVVREELQREGYPTWLAPGAIWAASIFGGETFLEPSPQLAFINHLNRPIFAMHGTADTRVLPHHTVDMEVMAQQKGANLITWFADNATHSGIKYMYPEEFSRRVVDFYSKSLEGDLAPNK
jgi:dipeptidyl aminopeptidase/acylaminoacyl peptidase